MNLAAATALVVLAAGLGPAVSPALAEVIPVDSLAGLRQALAEARPGDEIRLGPGRYRGRLHLDCTPNGAPGRPIRICGAAGPARSVIDGGGATIVVKFSAVGFIELCDLEITGGAYHGIFFDRGAHDIRIQGNRVHDNTLARPLIGNAEIKGSALRPEDATRRIQIVGNEIFHGEHPAGVNFQGIDCNLCLDYVVRGNLLHDIRPSATDDGRAKSPSFHDRGSCIQIKGGSAGTVVEGNLIQDCAYGIVFGGEFRTPPSHAGGRVVANVVVGSRGAGMVSLSAVGAEIVGNLILGSAVSLIVKPDSRAPDFAGAIRFLGNGHDGGLRISGPTRVTLQGNCRVAWSGRRPPGRGLGDLAARLAAYRAAVEPQDCAWPKR